MQNYRLKFEKNERVRQSDENAGAGNAKLTELNAALTVSSLAVLTAEIPLPGPMPGSQPQAMHPEPYVIVG